MSKVKEEERIERIIRNLLKMPENRRCINCNSLGPQYVCTTFWTFVCTNCSGIHREFMHRVKSVSVAKFNAEEIDALQAGGNERARQIYFKEWDPQRFPLPDSSQNRIRDFIKHVYVDRKFTGERSMGRQSMIESIKEELSRRPSFEKPGRRERFEDRSDVCYLEKRRSHYENFPRVRPNVLRTHSCNFEIVDDRVRDDRRSEIRRISSLKWTKTNIGSQSTASQTNRKTFNPSLVVRPFKDIPGAVHEPRRLVKPDGNISSRDQTRLTSSSCSGSMGGKQSPQTIVNLMDFGYEPEPVGPQTQEETKSSEADNGASGQSSMQKVSDIPGSSNFESLLFAFSDPITPADTTSALHNASDTATTSKATNIPTTKSMPCFQSTNYWGSPDLLAKSNTISRQELPEDLFSSSYANWQGVHTHNNNTMHVATSSNSTESRNPFDLDDDEILAHNSMHTSAPASSQFMQQQYYPSLTPPQLSYSEMQSSSGAIQGQQLPSGTVFLIGGEAVSGSWNGNQPFAGDYQLNSANPTSFSSTKGNPFM